MSSRKSKTAGMGKRIRKLRESKGLTQEQLAEAVGRDAGQPLTKSAAAKWEGVALPRTGLIPSIRKVLDTSFEYLFGESKAA